MHPAHEKFASNPVFCGLSDLFALIDKIETLERHFVLGPIYQDVFRTATAQAAPGVPEEDLMDALYDKFKAKVRGLVPPISERQAVMLVVMTTLMWLAGSSDETKFETFVVGNRVGIEEDSQRLQNGEISQQEFERRRGEHEERMNNLRSDMELRRGYYARFCENVVAHLPDGRPT